MPHPLQDDGSLMVGAEALRALAHPLRVQLLERLGVRLSATASMLARDIGESSGATSYHLRQLARHGLIEEDAGRGTARERWWRRRPGGLTVFGHDFLADPGTRAAAELVIGEIHRGMVRRLEHWLATATTDWPREWIEASVDSYQTLRLDAGQLRDLVAELHGVLARYHDLPPGEGASPVEVQLNAFPKPEAT
jgi:DNA-binding transcriptional ArsR family regulator